MLAGQRLLHFGAGGPEGGFQLHAVQMQRLVFGVCHAAYHQLRRERPGLAHAIAHAIDGDAGFFVQFARHGGFQRLAWLHKARQR